MMRDFLSDRSKLNEIGMIWNAVAKNLKVISSLFGQSRKWRNWISEHFEPKKFEPSSVVLQNIGVLPSRLQTFHTRTALKNMSKTFESKATRRNSPGNVMTFVWRFDPLGCLVSASLVALSDALWIALCDVMACDLFEVLENEFE